MIFQETDLSNHEFQTVNHALQLFDIKDAMRVYQVIAGIHFLNQIDFTDIANDHGTTAIMEESSLVNFRKASLLLKIADEELSAILTVRTRQVLNQSIKYEYENFYWLLSLFSNNLLVIGFYFVPVLL